MVVVALKQPSRFNCASLRELRSAVEKDDLFEAAMEQLDELNDHESLLNHELCEMQKELGDLEIFAHRLPPEDVATRLDLVSLKMQTLQKPSTFQLKKKFTDLKRQIKHLEFLQEFPIAHELNADSFQANLIHRISQQMRSAPRRKASSLKRTLTALRKKCSLAEKAFAKDGATKKAAALMEQLSYDMMHSG